VLRCSKTVRGEHYAIDRPFKRGVDMEGLQESLKQIQMFQQQLQILANQKYQIIIELKEVETALEHIDKLKEKTETYYLIGKLLVKKSKEDIVKELKDKKNTLELRIKALEKQESRLREKLDELRGKLQGLGIGAG